jgi:hypothetical protein
MASRLSHIDLSNDVFECNDVLCNNKDHRKYIEVYCCKIIDCIIESSKCIPRTSPKRKKSRTPGWNSNVAKNKQEAMFWHRLWLLNGKPPDGLIFDNMRSSRKEYHYSIRSVRKNENHLRKVNFLNAMLKDGRDFVSEIKKVKGSPSGLSTSVNGRHDTKEISEAFADEYKALYNSCTYPEHFFDDLMNDISKDIKMSQSSINDCHVRRCDIIHAVRKIKSDKADGVFDLVSDNLKYAPDELNDHLSRLYSSCLLHGFIPITLLLSTIIPIPKDRLGDLTTSNNYRGIALCALLFKILEYVILELHCKCLMSSDSQFAYKQNCSTTQCTWVASETIHYYKNCKSDVFACLLDCSKAFDKIRYDILFTKLMEKGLSPLILRTIVFSYIHSSVRVKWNGVFSESFDVVNGVRQGAILSPLLFNVYIDELVSNLKNSRNGCWVGSQYYGCLVYADDIMLLAPTVTSLKKMIHTCELFGTEKGLQFNDKKTICIHFHNSRNCSNSSLPNIFLNNKLLKWCSHVKHLGHIISCCAEFQNDILFRKGKFIACVNNILTEFSFAHPSTKVKLLQMYGCSFYGSCLWDLYSTQAEKLFTSWNIAIRKLFKLPRRTHTRFIEPISGIPHVRYTLKLRYINFVQSLMKSNNELVQNLLKYSITSHLSPSGLVLSRILNEYELCRLSSCLLILPSLHIDLALKHRTKHSLTEKDLCYINVIKDIVNCREGTHTCCLMDDEMNAMLHDLCEE